MKRILLVLLILVVAAGASAGLFEIRSRFFSKWFTGVVYDDRVHYLSCAELPPVADVEQALRDHPDTVDQIIEITGDPFSIQPSNGDRDCTETGDILITHCCRDVRAKVEQLLGDTFFGIPYRMHNI